LASESIAPTAATSDFVFNSIQQRKLVSILDERTLIFDPILSEHNDPTTNTRSSRRSTFSHGQKRQKEIKYGFDRVFPPESTQVEVFESTCLPLLDKVLEGYNATVFAYGATGCGKTHTITGTPEEPGVIFLTMSALFDKIDASADEKITDLTLSYLEVYNETIRDLLLPEGGLSLPLDLREDEHNVYVTNLSEHRPTSREDVMNMLIKGNNCRTRAPTEANAVSSRSHAVLQIHLKQRDRGGGLLVDGMSTGASYTTATLSIIDLAGSERASVTKNKGERLLEGANINRSLLSLGNCISALCSEKTHIPYRDSKLTRLLKFSLGGNCRVVMIANISPAPHHYEETHSTLKYANRAKNIKSRVTERNVTSVGIHESQYPLLIAELRAQVSALQCQLDTLSLTATTSDNQTTEIVRATPSHTSCPKLFSKIQSSYSHLYTRQEILSHSKHAISQNTRRFTVLSTLLASIPQSPRTQTHERLFLDLARALSRAVDDISADNVGKRHAVCRDEEFISRIRARIQKLGKEGGISVQREIVQRENELQIMALEHREALRGHSAGGDVDREFTELSQAFIRLLDGCADEIVVEEGMYTIEGILMRGLGTAGGGDNGLVVSEAESDVSFMTDYDDEDSNVSEMDLDARDQTPQRNILQELESASNIIAAEEATPTVARIAAAAKLNFTPVPADRMLADLLMEMDEESTPKIGKRARKSGIPRLSMPPGSGRESGENRGTEDENIGPIRCSPARRQARNSSRRSMIPVLRSALASSKLRDDSLESPDRVEVTKVVDEPPMSLRRSTRKKKVAVSSTKTANRRRK